MLGPILASGGVTLENDSTKAKLLFNTIEATDQFLPGRNFDHLFIPASTTADYPILIAHQILNDSTQYHRAKALEYQQEVTRRKALVGNLNELSLLELPVGLVGEGGDFRYTIIISHVRVTPNGAFIEAYMMFELPNR